MSSNSWQDELKPILTKKIEEAMNADELGDVLFPWLGNDCYRIMADAAIAILRGMEDAQTYLQEEGYLDK